MDFSDTLFTSLSSNQPFPFPNPREIGKKKIWKRIILSHCITYSLIVIIMTAKGAGLADFIQPGLIQLQPNLDDISFMDTLEPLHGI